MLVVQDILGPDGAIARRLGTAYEPRPEQVEMADAVAAALDEGHHLLAEAGTGVGKSFAYLVPAIDYAVRNKRRVVISTHTIALQEQLIDKDIPLLRAVMPQEFTAVLVKGRGNYVCRRRLEQARGRKNYLFETERQHKSLRVIEEWAEKSTDGSLSTLPEPPEPGVWEKVNAEAGNCLGKKCGFYNTCSWQAAKRRMNSGTILVVNHALFFSDLALRMAGVNYLPKYDAVIFDEAHTIEDVAGQHFGLKLSESSLRYQLRSLFDPKRGRGVLSTHGPKANDAIRIVMELHDETTVFFDTVATYQEKHGRPNGRVHEANVVPNDLSPKLRDLSKFLKELLACLKDDAEIAELTSTAAKVSATAEIIETVVSHKLPDAVYWFEVTGRTPKRVSLHAAPVDVAEGLRAGLFESTRTVIGTSATLCTTGAKKLGTANSSRGTGYQPVSAPDLMPALNESPDVHKRQGANLPHWTKDGGIYALTFRLADSLPVSVAQTAEIIGSRIAKSESGSALDEELDRGHGACWLNDSRVAELVRDQFTHFAGERYRLLAYCVMPNHVHAVLQPLRSLELPQIMHSIKSYTASNANKILGRTGPFWQAEYYDHLVRDVDDLRQQVSYVLVNQLRAGLADQGLTFSDSHAIEHAIRGESASKGHELIAHATKNKQVTSPPRRVADPFSFVKRRLGAGDARTIQLGSPFDYANQATLYIETGLPEPTDRRFLPAACAKIFHYVKKTHGGAFVLFTSYKQLVEAANALQRDIEALGLTFLVQGQQAPRNVLLEKFRAADDAVLFGTSSFWQGIDVRGEKLRNVIIVKLPFAVPDEPLTEAKLETITRQGGNAFMELSVPEAVIRLKQGFGRLIRSKTDKGIVVLLDARVRTKRYGKIFLDALPECRVIDVKD